MRISSFEVEQTAVSKQQRFEIKEEKIEIFKIESQIVNNGSAINISAEGLKMLENEEEEDFITLTDEQKAKIMLLEDFISSITRKRFRFKQFEKLNNKRKPFKEVKNNNVGDRVNGQVGIRISRNHEIHEVSKMKFESKGKILTEDGRAIDFKLNLSMSREYYEKNSEMLEIGNNMKDPLVINLDSKGISFGNKTINIDLDLDGKIDEFRSLTSGSGFLALDKNNNGIVDDGNELFGPQNGRGFDELRKYDSDGNMWIDENDEVFNSLKIWTVDDEGNEELIGIKEAGLGAIYLGEVESPFDMKDGDETLGRIADTSIYLRENGQAGVIHELDLKI